MCLSICSNLIWFFFCSCAIYCVMKMLKLLLTSSAYANIVQVTQQKQSSPEEQNRAITLQNTVLTTSEYKTKSTATLLAKQHYQKVFRIYCTVGKLICGSYLAACISDTRSDLHHIPSSSGTHMCSWRGYFCLQ